MKYLVLFCFLTLVYSSKACDNSSISIANAVSNPDGSVTYTLNLLTELGGLDATFYGFALVFNSSQNTPEVVAYPATLANSDLSSGFLSETLTGLTGSDINSVVGDGNWNQYMNDINVLSYEDGSIFGAASNDIGFTLSVTVMGCVEEILFNSSVNSGAAACIMSASTGLSCALCDISAISVGAQTACDPLTNTYAQTLTLTYSNPPGTGNLLVNGQSYSITSSPQVIVLTGLDSDGNDVDVTATFTADPTCTLTELDLFTAPISCALPCTPDNGTWD